MTQAGECFAATLDTLEKSTPCTFREGVERWRCVLAGNSDHLASNITRDRSVAKPQTPIRLSQVHAKCWPSQAHHLIPHQQLARHAVTQWIAESKGKLLGDCDYSVNHGNNGKFMPYASSLEDWKSASTERRREIADAVMRRAGIQLHQGPHRYKPYGQGHAGYKTRVAEYLQKITSHSAGHYSASSGCAECRQRTNGKVQPRRNTVQMLDRASRQLESDIRRGRIFVSRRAADHVDDVGPLRG